MPKVLTVDRKKGYCIVHLEGGFKLYRRSARQNESGAWRLGPPVYPDTHEVWVSLQGEIR